MAKEKVVEEEVEEKKPAKAKKLEGVVVGRNVHYEQSGGDVSVAFISRVHDAETGLVNLYVIQDGAVRATNFVDGVIYADGHVSGTWHFIEKA
jgi:hypothetical protein